MDPLRHTLGVVLFLMALPLAYKFGRALDRSTVDSPLKPFGLFVTGAVIAVFLGIFVFILWALCDAALVSLDLLPKPYHDFSELIELLAAPLLYLAAFWVGSQSSEQGASAGDPAQVRAVLPTAERAEPSPLAGAPVRQTRGYIVALAIIGSPVVALLAMYLLSWITGVQRGGMESVGFPRFLFVLWVWGATGWIYAIPIAAVVFAISWVGNSARKID